MLPTDDSPNRAVASPGRISRKLGNLKPAVAARFWIRPPPESKCARVVPSNSMYEPSVSVARAAPNVIGFEVRAQPGPASSWALAVPVESPVRRVVASTELARNMEVVFMDVSPVFAGVTEHPSEGVPELRTREQELVRYQGKRRGKSPQNHHVDVDPVLGVGRSDACDGFPDSSRGVRDRPSRAASTTNVFDLAQ